MGEQSPTKSNKNGNTNHTYLHGYFNEHILQLR
jgi:hypothetical protein